jgi:hypothetical protein
MCNELTDRARLRNAFTMIRRAGFGARLGLSHTNAASELANAKQGFCYITPAQMSETGIGGYSEWMEDDDGVFSYLAGTLYIHFKTASCEAHDLATFGEMIVKRIKAAGLETDWTGNPRHSIRVTR